MIEVASRERPRVGDRVHRRHQLMASQVQCSQKPTGTKCLTQSFHLHLLLKLFCISYLMMIRNISKSFILMKN